MMQDDLRKDIETAINRHCGENASNTPDFMLADYLMLCLEAFDKTVSAREKWYGRDPGIGPAGIPTDGRMILLDDPIAAQPPEQREGER
jgi:hypothetical protein